MKNVLIKADLHVHSTCSDGKASPLEIIHVALERGLGAISVTDHDTFEGSRLAQRLASHYGILVIPGVEVRTDQGDILLYCEKEINFPRGVEQLISKAHEENCLVVPAHPFDVMRLGIGELIYEYDEWDAIEVWNASSTKRANRKALEVARLLNKPGIASSDAHTVEEVGSAYTIVEIGDLSIGEVLEAVRKNRVKLHFGEISLKTRLNRLVWSVERSLRKLTK